MNTFALDTPRPNVAEYLRHATPRNGFTSSQHYLPYQLSNPLSQIVSQSLSHPLKEEQEEELQQANAENTAENTTENTAEKPSGNKATIVKNTAQLSKIPRHMLSTVPHQIITQQAENTTATWPVIPTALIWYITAITSQEEDLLRRSQPIRPLQKFPWP
ncbi:hypothetical protein HO173_012236 [Letharia columbiana]|uniref:Uncharacterized protein n=1 Tax=Letharia columbiana TaxID=112416 RepID=A0A8H6FGQ6_9LECA|nr:uncharacterized protein HO173_012236 [Letharia columbiana]KAF6227496.1 hypothetical protein HO173_012236 [Letharia columbiana]